MKTQILLVLLGASLAVGFKTGSNFCDDEKERFDTCKPLCNHDGAGYGSHEGSNEGSQSGEISGSGSASGSGSGSGSGNSSWEVSGSGSASGSWENSGSGSGSAECPCGEWQEGEYCFLFQWFIKFSINIEIIEIRNIFLTWIKKTQLTVVENVELTEYQILVEIYYSLQILFEEHVEIKKAIEYEYIGEWGYVFELEGLCHDIQTSTTEVSVEGCITISGGKCPLTDALEECGKNATDSEQEAIDSLIVNITAIINSEWSFSYKLTLIYELFAEFFIEFPELKVKILKGKIEGFGVIHSFFDICTVYWRIENFSLVAGGGSSDTDCPLLEALFKLYSDTSYSKSERSDFKQLHDKIQVYFQANVDITVRVQYFAEQLYQFYLLSNWSVEAIYSIKIKGYGSLYQFIYAYIYKTNNGVVFPPKTTTTKTSTSTSTSTTKTSTSTSTSTSTPAVTTTKTPTGHCGNVTLVNVVNMNTTLLLKAIDASQASGAWTSTQITSFVGYKKRIYTVSIAGTSSNKTATYQSIRSTLVSFTTNAQFMTLVQSIFISTWGTISQYCGCQNSTILA